MRDLIGRTFGHYRIVEKIGEGGMGEVYRAHDEQLDRDVAIKVLPEEVVNNPDRLARFEREAKVVARLAHPNILDVYELGDHEGRPFMATELLEGETLRERLEGGSLGWRKATEIGAAIADGLGAAHEAGICHRDLKPSNVFLTADGRVKVLDFGLARHEDAGGGKDVTHAPTVTRHTAPGTVLGTVGYMSPEQVRGETVDQRSDIFSLGCVLYEMVSGQRAFTGDSAVETMNAILKEEPSDVSASGRELPPELAGTIRRCLEKRPQARFQSASDLAYNLRTISSASVPSGAREAPADARRGKRGRWIAVGVAAVIVIAVALTAVLRQSRQEEARTPAMGVTLEWVAGAPFENRTGDASLDPLGQRAVDLIVQRFSEVGMADGVLTMDAVPFPPGGRNRRETPPRLDSGDQPIGEKEPFVLVSGSYYLDGEELEFQARLTDYETGELLYAFKPINATRLDAAEALDDLRERVVAAVGFHWSEAYDVRVNNPPSSYAALRALDQGWRAFVSDWEEAVAALEKTLELDQDFHLPRLMLPIAYWNLGEMEQADRELLVARDRQHEFTVFEQALLDYLLAAQKRNRPEVVSRVRRMLKIAPHYAWVRMVLAMSLSRLNRPKETLEVLEPVLPAYEDESLPSARWILDIASQAQHSLGEYEQQLEWANVGLELFPDVGDFFYHKGAALAAMGRLDAVDSVIEECARVQLRESAMNAGTVMYWVALELRTHGHRRESDELAVRAVDWFERRAIGLHIEDRDSRELGRHSEALRVAGRWDEAKTFQMERKERGHKEKGYLPISVAGALGVIAARTGDHDEAWRIFNEFPNPGPPFNPGRRCYWRACIAAHLGEKDMAVELLKEGYAKGLGHDWYDHIDVDLEPLWDYPPFQELIEPKG
jgi:tetratricopeptide (TPR) repeat protein